MKDNYDFSKAVKNPYAENLKKNGYTVMINYSPKGVAETDGEEERKPTPDEFAAFEVYRADNKAQ